MRSATGRAQSLDALSPRQYEVAHLVAVGRTDKQIGAMLGIKEGTVRDYVDQIIDRLGIDRGANVRVMICRAVVIPGGDARHPRGADSGADTRPPTLETSQPFHSGAAPEANHAE